MKTFSLVAGVLSIILTNIASANNVPPSDGRTYNVAYNWSPQQTVEVNAQVADVFRLVMLMHFSNQGVYSQPIPDQLVYRYTAVKSTSSNKVRVTYQFAKPGYWVAESDSSFGVEPVFFKDGVYYLLYSGEVYSLNEFPYTAN